MGSSTGDVVRGQPTTDGPSDYSRLNPRPGVSLWRCRECGDQMNTKEAYETHIKARHPHLLAKHGIDG